MEWLVCNLTDPSLERNGYLFIFMLVSDQDLRIVGDGPFDSFDLNSDGSLVAYLYDGYYLVVIQQKLGVPEVVYPCYTASLYLKYY